MGPARTMVDNEPDKHHFAPRCYIKRWAGPDRRLVEFKRRHGKVEGRWTAPKGTGYRPGLYTIPDAADGRKNLVESRYLHRVDTDGSKCLDAALGPTAEIPLERASQWARFIMRMMRGSPDKLEETEAKARFDAAENPHRYQAEWEKVRRPGDPQTWEEGFQTLDEAALRGFGARALPKMSDLPGVGQAIIDMRWSVMRRLDRRFPMLTSDKPVITSNGLGKPDAYVLLPISPEVLFMATKSEATRQNFVHQFETGELIEKLNHLVTVQAHEFVYANSTVALAFVEERLGQFEAKTL